MKLHFQTEATYKSQKEDPAAVNQIAPALPTPIVLGQLMAAGAEIVAKEVGGKTAVMAAVEVCSFPRRTFSRN